MLRGSVLVLATFAAGEAWAQSSQPASRPAASASADPASLAAQVTMIVEIDEHHLKVQENWQMRNPGAGVVKSSNITFDLGSKVRRIQMDESATGFAHVEGEKTIRATRDLGPGVHGFAVSYLLDLDGSTARFSRRFPVSVAGSRLIVEDFGGLETSGATPLSTRSRDLNGLSFRIFDFSVAKGEALDVTLMGLPSRSAWPRRVAVALAALAFIWMVVSLLRPGHDRRAVQGALSAEARREQILRALELLEEDLDEGRIESKKHEKRRKALMGELARVLREAELSKNDDGGGAQPA